MRIVGTIIALMSMPGRAVKKLSATKPVRRATNVTIEATLLQRAKTLRVNLSRAAEDGLSRAVATRQSEIWLEENRAALDSSTAYVEANGLPLARFRNF